jgi:hypothetical protein
MTTSRKTRRRLMSILPLFRLNQAPYQITRLSVSYRFEAVYFRVQKYVLIVVRRRAWTCSACREQVHGRIARRPELATPPSLTTFTAGRILWCRHLLCRVNVRSTFDKSPGPTPTAGLVSSAGMSHPRQKYAEMCRNRVFTIDRSGGRADGRLSRNFALAGRRKPGIRAGKHVARRRRHIRLAQLRCVLCFSGAPRHEPHKKRRCCRQPVWKLRHDVRIEMIKKAGCASL